MIAGRIMTGETAFLFVYGTLRSADVGPTGRDQRHRLAREARIVGAATLEGRLYDLGRYPGLVVATGQGLGEAAADSTVHGELLELADPARTLAWLDDYEGIVPGRDPDNEAESEYERRVLSVAQVGGGRVSAWVYLYLQPVRGYPLIVGGDWLDRT